VCVCVCVHCSVVQVHYLLQLEDVLVEVVLESLVGKVDAELLKAVVLVVLEAEDVQHSDGQYLAGKHEYWCSIICSDPG